MKKTGVKLTGLAAGAFLYAFAAPALAEEDAATPVKSAPLAPDTAPADTAKPPVKSDRDAAVQTVDTWESYGGGGPETVEETFFRLSRDFVTNSEDGFKRLGSVPIWPRGDLKVGGIRLMPFVREAVQYTSNYYLHNNTGSTTGDHGTSNQFTHINEIGCLADTALAGGRLRLSASVDSTWNVNYNSVPDTWDFMGALGATYRWDTGVWIAGGVSYERRHDPADLPNLANDFARTNTRTFFNLGFDRDIFFGTKIKWEFGVQTQQPHASDAAFSAMDRTEITVFAKGSYPFLKNTTRLFVIASERWDQRDSNAVNNGKAFGLNFGIEGSIPIRSGEYRGIRGQVSVGFENALYTSDQYRQGSATVVNDTNRTATHVTAQAALQYVMSMKSTVDLRYLHQTEFSFYGNYQVVDRVDLTFSHNFTRQLTGRIGTFFEHTDPSGENPQQTIPPNNYARDAGTVTRVGIGAGARYAINEWLDVDASADVENRNDHSAKSYRVYTGVVGLTFYLNALTPKVRTAVSR